nr:hypothetical protein [Tanacetum cinerariifolium]
MEAPKELPKVSLVNESLKKIKFHLTKFDNMVKIRATPDDRRKPKNVKNVGLSKKAKIVESKNANHSESNNAWGSNATDIPSSSSLVMIGCPDCSLVSGHRMFKTYDREPLSAHELCVDQLSLDDMLKTSLICLLSKALKTKSWLWHR